MNFERLKLEDVGKFKEMVIKGHYFNNVDYVNNIEKAIYHWVDEGSRFEHSDILEFNINLLENELKDIFSFKGTLYRGINVDYKEEIKEYPNKLESFTSSLRKALSFTEFGDTLYPLDEYSSEYIENTRFHVVVKKDAEALALDDLIKLIGENSSNEEIADLFKTFVAEKEMVSWGSYDEIREYSLYDIKLLVDNNEIEFPNE